MNYNTVEGSRLTIEREQIERTRFTKPEQQLTSKHEGKSRDTTKFFLSRGSHKSSLAGLLVARPERVRAVTSIIFCDLHIQLKTSSDQTLIAFSNIP